MPRRTNEWLNELDLPKTAPQESYELLSGKIELLPTMLLDPSYFGAPDDWDGGKEITHRENGLTIKSQPDEIQRKLWKEYFDSIGIDINEFKILDVSYVAVRNVSKETFQKLRNYYIPRDRWQDFKTLLFNQGAFILLHNDEVVIHEHCCCDFSNMGGWAKIPYYRGADWRGIWIGHPGIAIRYDIESDLVIIRQYANDNGEIRNHVAVQPGKLMNAIIDGDAITDNILQSVSPNQESYQISRELMNRTHYRYDF